MWLKKYNGTATLPTVLIMATIVMEIAVGAVIVAALLNGAAYNRRLSSQALEMARTGAQDALIYIGRYCSSISGCTRSYTLTIDSKVVDINIVDSGGGIVTINSVGRVNQREKKMEVIVGIDASTAEINIRSFREVPL
ncbi:MAG: hypothetical protein V1652_03845 [bacterium]